MSKEIKKIKTLGYSHLEQSALAWWMSKRPTVWTREEHLANPIVNTTTEAEKQLALAVAAMLMELDK